MVSDANEMQIGGDHYRGEFQVWDLVARLGLNFFEGCALKYVTRWRRKGGTNDLEKAIHFLEKLAELRYDPAAAAMFGDYLGRRSSATWAVQLAHEFAEANDIPPVDRAAITYILFWDTRPNLRKGIDLLRRMIEDYSGSD